jgi:outer membrane protein OmpA-like peptidoglycan-associated protein
MLSALLMGCEQIPIKGTLPTLPTRTVVVHPPEQTKSEINSSLSEESLWKQLVLSGDTAAAVKNWQEAAKFYNQALDTIDDQRATPVPPTSSEIKRLQRVAQQVQILAANVKTRSLKITSTCDNIFRESTRGVVVDSNLIAVHFQLNQKSLDKTGGKYIQHVADCLKQKQYTKLRLIGHTDASGAAEANRELSLKRAEMLRELLLSNGVSSEIFVEGKGEDEPIQIEHGDKLDQKEIDALNRRVEIQKL